MSCMSLSSTHNHNRHMNNDTTTNPTYISIYSAQILRALIFICSKFHIWFGPSSVSIENRRYIHLVQIWPLLTCILTLTPRFFQCKCEIRKTLVDSMSNNYSEVSHLAILEFPQVLWDRLTENFRFVLI